MADSGEAFDVLYRVNDGTLRPGVVGDVVDAWLTVQQAFIQLTEHYKTVVGLHLDKLLGSCVSLVYLHKGDVVETAETMMHQVNMVAIKPGRDDHDARAAGRLTHPFHGLMTVVGGSVHRRCLSCLNS
ncbi:hypothetical protein [Pseudomonas sp. NFX98]|uniref:hypothetical protein n=1 Tax=Pseudomonas sp. NFX98 TaxID=3399122 RepID=UPI0039FD468B